MLIITLINGKQYKYEYPISPLYIIQNINPILSKRCVAAKVNGKLIDIVDLINNDGILEFITFDNYLGLCIIKRSFVHLLGHAIKQLWPSAKMVMGSETDTGFYYDIDLDYQLNSNDLNILEQRMHLLISQKFNITKKLVPLKQAKQIFSNRKETYKVLILNKKLIPSECIKLYFYKEYIDFCEGPNVPNINFCRYFKLYKISQSFYQKKINISKKVLQRICGIIWSYKNDDYQTSSIYLDKPKFYKTADHRDLASQLDLYHIQEDAPGMVFWHKNGWVIFQELKSFLRKKLKKYQYQEVKSPIMIDRLLWKKTGHWDNYYEHIFTTSSENRKYCIKPMSCPGHVQIFNQGIKSYKDLPIRIAEFGHCHRNEPSGALHGLMRIREFTQDDAHIFCSVNQIQDELNHCIKMMYDIYRVFNFKDIIVKLSTRPKKRIGEDKIWDIAEQHLSTVLKKNNISFTYQLQDGAFYGPKIEFILLDSLKRSWQCGTIQLDFSLPNLLGARYIDNNNLYQVPIIIHRAILGSLERFIGLITEEYLGFLPTWLAPIQIVLMNITSEQSTYVNNLAKKFTDKNFRVKTDLRNEKIGFKIRLHTIHRIPYMLICGNSEMDHNTVSIRTFKGKQLKNYKIDIFLEKLTHEIHSYSFHQLKE